MSSSDSSDHSSAEKSNHSSAEKSNQNSAKITSGGMDYKTAGVDVEAGDRLVDWLQASSGSNASRDGDKTSLEKPPHADKLISGIGGFAAIFRMQFPEMKKPCLVTSTDGVGTKIKLAADFEKYDTVGQDLVAMCVNDLVCCGAQPLFFLDYYATGKLDVEATKIFLQGVRRACHESGAALIGGETAEMPGLYHGRDFDAAGFAVGIVDEDDLLGAPRVSVGDRVIGIASSGFHSNGYSLIRKIFAPEIEAELANPKPLNEPSQWRDLLLTPTHLYAKVVLALKAQSLLQAVANVTGGGMENLPRVMPKGTVLSLIDWSWPDIFIELQDRAGLSRTEMLKTLNCGIGMALTVKPEHVTETEAMIEQHGFRSVSLGEIRRASDANAEPEVLY